MDGKKTYACDTACFLFGGGGVLIMEMGVRFLSC